MTTILDLDVQLRALNRRVEEAVEERRAWMDAHMTDYAKYKVGDTLINLETGETLGVITKLYRFWGDGRDWRFDDSMNISYEYRCPNGTIDNTSSRLLLKFGTHEDYYNELERRVRDVRSRLKSA